MRCFKDTSYSQIYTHTYAHRNNNVTFVKIILPRILRESDLTKNPGGKLQLIATGDDWTKYKNSIIKPHPKIHYWNILINSNCRLLKHFNFLLCIFNEFIQLLWNVLDIWYNSKKSNWNLWIPNPTKTYTLKYVRLRTWFGYAFFNGDWIIRKDY